MRPEKSSALEYCAENTSQRTVLVVAEFGKMVMAYQKGLGLVLCTVAGGNSARWFLYLNSNTLPSGFFSASRASTAGEMFGSLGFSVC